jgi:hypothetical protein
LCAIGDQAPRTGDEYEGRGRCRHAVYDGRHLAVVRLQRIVDRDTVEGETTTGVDAGGDVTAQLGQRFQDFGGGEAFSAHLHADRAIEDQFAVDDEFVCHAIAFRQFETPPRHPMVDGRMARRPGREGAPVKLCGRVRRRSPGRWR